MTAPITLLLFILIGIIFLFIFLYFVPVNLWITAIFSGVQIGVFQLIFMRIRKTPVHKVVNDLISLRKAGINIDIAQLETHHLAGGDIDKVTTGMIAAKNSGQALSWQEATAMDLSGKDITYFLKKKKLEMDGGIDKLREQLSSAILNILDTDEVKEIARVMERMKSFKS